MLLSWLLGALAILAAILGVVKLYREVFRAPALGIVAAEIRPGVLPATQSAVLTVFGHFPAFDAGPTSQVAFTINALVENGGTGPARSVLLIHKLERSSMTKIQPWWDGTRFSIPPFPRTIMPGAPAVPFEIGVTLVVLGSTFNRKQASFTVWAIAESGAAAGAELFVGFEDGTPARISVGHVPAGLWETIRTRIAVALMAKRVFYSTFLGRLVYRWVPPDSRLFFSMQSWRSMVRPRPERE